MTDTTGGREFMTRATVAELMRLGGIPLTDHLQRADRADLEAITVALFGAWHGIVPDTAALCRWWRLYAEKAGNAECATATLDAERRKTAR